MRYLLVVGKKHWSYSARLFSNHLGYIASDFMRIVTVSCLSMHALILDKSTCLGQRLNMKRAPQWVAMHTKVGTDVNFGEWVPQSLDITRLLRAIQVYQLQFLSWKSFLIPISPLCLSFLSAGRLSNTWFTCDRWLWRWFCSSL